jgi:hypothetical protein
MEDIIENEKTNSTRKDTRLRVSRILLKIQDNNINQIEEALKTKYKEEISYCCISNTELITYVYLQFKNRLRFMANKNPFTELFLNLLDFEIVQPTLEDQRRVYELARKGNFCREFGKKDSSLKDLNIEEYSQYNSNISKKISSSEDKKIFSGHCFLMTIMQIGELRKEKIQEKLLEKYPNDLVYICASKEIHTEEKGQEIKEIYQQETLDQSLNKKLCNILICFNKSKRITVSKKNKNSIETLFNRTVYIREVRLSKEKLKQALLFVKKNQDYLEYGEINIQTNDAEYLNKDNVEDYVMNMITKGCTFEELLKHEMEVVVKYMLENSDRFKRMINDIALRDNQYTSRELLYEKIALALSAQRVIGVDNESEVIDVVYKLVSVLKKEQNQEVSLAE